MKIWAKTDGPVREGKYLVVRRDGTIPEWPHFVMGGYDPCVPAALLVYAAEARRRGYDEAFCASVEELAADFLLLSATPRAVSVADPDAGPHRTDNPAVIEMMRGHGDLTGLGQGALEGKTEALIEMQTRIVLEPSRLPYRPKFDGELNRMSRAFEVAFKASGATWQWQTWGQILGAMEAAIRILPDEAKS